MSNELILAMYLMAVGLAMAAAGTYLYQWIFGETAMLRYDGKTFAHTLAHVFMSFVCGPFIMLQLGWQQERNGTLSLVPVLVGSLVGFGWAFITGLIAVGCYASIL
ncbi:MAG TPA: hypothetical protein VGM83_05235 [Devosiaceae bacterium]|jgi:hypothetical protein